MTPDKLPTVAQAMKLASEVYSERGGLSALQRVAYFRGFGDAIELVKAMLRDAEMEKAEPK